MPQFYFETLFDIEESVAEWPPAFAIITAYATTGEAWSPAENEAADRRLTAELARRRGWRSRVIGYLREPDHAEPGWAVGLSFEDACDLGQRFHQDAIYYVDGDELSVSYCDARRTPIAVGAFRARVVPR